MVDIYEQEGQPEIHRRGFHYQIVGKGYESHKELFREWAGQHPVEI